MIEIYEYPKDLGIKKPKLLKTLKEAIFSKFEKENINIVFLSLLKIKKLNREYREVDLPTDVLSFNYNTESLLGEVYICLEYIKKNTKEKNFLEEVLRLIVHGILHLYGYDHKKEFIDLNQKDLEPMFVLQEELLNNILKKI